MHMRLLMKPLPPPQRKARRNFRCGRKRRQGAVAFDYDAEYIISPVIGQVAQLVEQWTENPCVGGSIPSLSTKGGRQAALTHFCFMPPPRQTGIAKSMKNY
jgi:hypothetical protein